MDINRAELYRDVVDLEELRDAYSKASPEVRDEIEREIDEKLEELNFEADEYIDQWVDLKDERSRALHSNEFPEEEMRSALPANVNFLLLRRYGYGALASALKDLKKEKEEVGSPRDLRVIKKAFYEFIDRLNTL
jgi:cobalamin biosynthesis Mg chelatase CobN